MVNTCAPSRTQQQDASSDYFRSGLELVCGTVTPRLWVPKVVEEIFRKSPADVLTKELPEIMKVLAKVADEEPSLCSSVLEKIPSIAAQAVENTERVEALKDVVGDYLIPLVVRNLGCSDTSVDRKAQAALIQMIEKGYVSKAQAEIKICPSILALTKMMESQLDVNSGAITLMSKLAPLLGRDITERILLERFTELCSSHLFYVRKLSASHFGHYCVVVGKAEFENTLLPCYLALCQDDVWGVRKACAEVIMFLSSVCPPELRKTLLATAFAKLLQDECRWVRLSAHHTLGAFIATFAEPPLTRIGYNASGDLVMMNQHDTEFHRVGIEGCNTGPTTFEEEFLLSVSLINLIDPKEEEESKNQEVTDLDEAISSKNREDVSLRADAALNEIVVVKEQSGNDSTIAKEPIQEHSYCKSPSNEEVKHEDELLSYNEFNYWHISPPEIDLGELLMGETNAADGERLSESSSEDIVTNHLEELYAAINLSDNSNDSSNDNRQNESIQPSGDNKSDNLDNKDSDVSDVNSSATLIEIKEPPQKIVPQDLIDSFVAMAQCDGNLVDNDIPYHCAYSLPAVILTLGKDNWTLLKDTMITLAGHMSYKIRRTIASSLHEIALILGPEVATEDLCPLFEDFLKDLDEVRIGILENLFNFLQLITPERRVTFLPKISDLLTVDNVCNWRFQESLAQQLTQCVQLFIPSDVVKYIGLYAKALMLYNVAAVRQSAMILVAQIVRRISIDHALTSRYLSGIAERFAHSKKWKPRQTFALLCIEMLSHKAMDSEEFATIMMPHLLDLSWDPVANVRLVVANCVVKHLLNQEHFADPGSEHIESLTTVLRRLQADKDRDVRMSSEVPSIY